MTAQIPERILVDGKPCWLLGQPLYDLLEDKGIAIQSPDVWTTACRRQYVGTWTIADGRLWLVALSTFGWDELPLSEAVQAEFLRRVPADRFPVPADWFDGHLRIPTGPRLIQHLTANGSWFTKERVVTCRKGRVIRDREVNTLAMLERELRRNEHLRRGLDIEEGATTNPLSWIADEDHDHLRGDWWPPGWMGGGNVPTADC